MAKLRAPLFSLGASQKLGDALVYFPWKGINAVREYVIPTNPRSAGQQTQRGHMEDGVDEWHGAAYTAPDATAWDRLAGVAESAMSGFNRFIREFINEAILGNTWTRVRNITFQNVGPNGFQVRCEKTSGVPSPRCLVGTSKTFFYYEDVMVDQGGNLWLVNIPNLTTKTLYYVYIYVGASGNNWGRTGIYQQKTT